MRATDRNHLPPELFLFFPIEVRAVDEERAMSGQPWTEDDNAKLKSLAGTKSPAEVAAQLGRTLTIEASNSAFLRLLRHTK